MVRDIRLQADPQEMIAAFRKRTARLDRGGDPDGRFLSARVAV